MVGIVAAAFPLSLLHSAIACSQFSKRLRSCGLLFQTTPPIQSEFKFFFPLSGFELNADPLIITTSCRRTLWKL